MLRIQIPKPPHVSRRFVQSNVTSCECTMSPSLKIETVSEGCPKVVSDGRFDCVDLDNGYTGALAMFFMVSSKTEWA